MPIKRSLIAVPLLAAFVTLAACSTHVQAQQPPKPPPQKAQAQPPLASFAAERIIVLPVQMLRADSGAFVTKAIWDGGFRKALDDSIGAAISDRGIGKAWNYAADVLRQSKRNIDFVGDPYAVGAQPLRGQLYKPQDHIPDVMFTNLRGLIALGNARFALVPVELVIQRDGPRQRAVLRLALVDGRLGEFLWVGEAASDPVTSLTPQLINSLVARVADFVALR
jgi:hypothetical protein